MVTTSILLPLDCKEEFEIYVDASNVVIGAVLNQRDEKGHNHPIYLTSHQLVQDEHNYKNTEREALRMIFLVQKFKHYPLNYKIVFHINIKE